MASLTYDSDSSIDENIRRQEEENDEIISDLLNAYRGREIFLATPFRGLLKVTLEESADPNYPFPPFLEINMVNNDKRPHEKYVRLGDMREDDDDDHLLMPWYYFIFPSTFPAVSYTKGSLEKKLKGLYMTKLIDKVTAANDAWLNRTKANRRNRDVIDLTSDSESQSLLQESVLKF